LGGLTGGTESKEGRESREAIKGVRGPAAGTGKRTVDTTRTLKRKLKLYFLYRV